MITIYENTTIPYNKPKIIFWLRPEAALGSSVASFVFFTPWQPIFGGRRPPYRLYNSTLCMFKLQLFFANKSFLLKVRLSYFPTHVCDGYHILKNNFYLYKNDLLMYSFKVSVLPLYEIKVLFFCNTLMILLIVSRVVPAMQERLVGRALPAEINPMVLKFTLPITTASIIYGRRCLPYIILKRSTL